MAQSCIFRLGPLALNATPTTNILNAGTTSGGTNCTSAPYNNLKIVLYQIHISNNTSGAVSFSLYVGGSGGNVAGTDLAKSVSIAANDVYDMYFSTGLVLTTSDFLVGGASAGASLTLTAVGEIGVA